MELEELKIAVLNMAGIEKLRPRHCLLISGLVYEKTGKQVSTSTLKRVYGFATKAVKTSAYTLNALEEFCQTEQLRKTA